MTRCLTTERLTVATLPLKVPSARLAFSLKKQGAPPFLGKPRRVVIVSHKPQFSPSMTSALTAKIATKATPYRVSTAMALCPVVGHSINQDLNRFGSEWPTRGFQA